MTAALKPAVETEELPWQFTRDVSDLRQELDRTQDSDRLKRFAERASEVARWITIKNLPQIDVLDRLHEVGVAVGLGADEIQAALAAAMAHPYDPPRPAEVVPLRNGTPPQPDPLRPLRLDELLALDVQPRRQLLSPILPERALAMLYAARGIGKTHFGLGMTHAMSLGGPFLNWVAPRAIRCLYIDGEMPMAALKERLENITGGCLQQPDPDAFRLLAADYHPNGLPNLATADGQAALEPVLEGVELIVLDNLSTLVPAARDNDADSWNLMQAWLLRQRRAGRAVLMCHHAGKGGQQRGTSRREDVLDTVIALRHPSDYTPEDGARFEVHIEKARGAFGNDVKPFEAKMQVVNGATVWTTRDLADANLSRVIDLLHDGLSIRDVAEETGLPKSTVGRLKKAAEARGEVFAKGAA